MIPYLFGGTAALAFAVVVVSTVAGGAKSERAVAAELNPAHTGTGGDPHTGELDSATAQWMADLCRAESTITEAVEPAEGSDEWWAAEWRRVDGVLHEAVTGFRRGLYTAVGPELVMAEQEFETSEFWAIVTRPSPALVELAWLATPTGQYSVVDGYQRAGWLR